MYRRVERVAGYRLSGFGTVVYLAAESEETRVTCDVHRRPSVFQRRFSPVVVVVASVVVVVVAQTASTGGSDGGGQWW